MSLHTVYEYILGTTDISFIILHFFHQCFIVNDYTVSLSFLNINQLIIKQFNTSLSLKIFYFFKYYNCIENMHVLIDCIFT